MAHGEMEGDRCGRNDCNGTIQIADSENCSCHISPPCGSCTAPREFCDACGWRSIDEPVPVMLAGFSGGPYLYSMEPRVPRPLDPTKIDYRIKGHTNSSQICEGVYPEGTSMADVRVRVDGTFGGRFEQFGGGTFKFIAYTD